jgi:hypothetical protein
MATTQLAPITKYFHIDNVPVSILGFTLPAFNLPFRSTAWFDTTVFGWVSDQIGREKMERRLAQIEESVARYLSQLDIADLQEPSEALAAKRAHLKEKLAKLAGEMHRLKAIEKEMLASSDQQISLTDPDSRSMATSGRGSPRACIFRLHLDRAWCICLADAARANRLSRDRIAPSGL